MKIEKLKVAIYPDNYGPDDASSPTWTRVLRNAGIEVKEVDVYRSDILDQLVGCHGFMWRHAHYVNMRRVARRLLPVIERELGLKVYPDQKTCWHYDDKISQHFLFQAHKIPTPKTWVFFSEKEAATWLRKASYPLVLKLWAGAGSTNVCLVESVDEGLHWLHKLFHVGLTGLTETSATFCERFQLARALLRDGLVTHAEELHKGYIYLQEFLPDNGYDTRITIIGKRAFGYRRFNRKNDFRASGSGVFDADSEKIDKRFVTLAFEAAASLGTTSLAIDGLYRDGEPVIGEISYTYVNWMVHDCQGYWDADLNWHVGQMWPEEAQVEDFIALLKGFDG